MSIGGAVSIANTIFTYFSPTKSPYYAVIAFGTVALAFSMHIGAVEWLTIFIPVLLAVALSTILSFMSRPEFTSDEYNDQLKFARAVGVSAGVLCLVAAGLVVAPGGEDGWAKTWHYWVVYWMSLIQILIFFLYIFIYHNYESTQRGINFVQLSLVISTFLIGTAFVGAEYTMSSTSLLISDHGPVVLVSLALLWLVCAAKLALYLVRNFKMAPPTDAVTGPSSHTTPSP